MKVYWEACITAVAVLLLLLLLLLLLMMMMMMMIIIIIITTTTTTFIGIILPRTKINMVTGFTPRYCASVGQYYDQCSVS